MARLQVFHKGEKILELDLIEGNSYIAGRKEGSEILLDKLPGISRQHFKVEYNGNEWQVDCLSQMKLLEFQGGESSSFPLQDGDKFSLSPYNFIFAAPSAQSTNEIAPDDSSNDMVEQTPVMSFDESEEPTPSSEDESESNTSTFRGNEDQTAIKSFNGIPYIKVLGQYGRKAEYFRLEGHLWIAGSDSNAPIYLADSDAASAHFEISRTDKGYFITDLGSRAGTLLNGQRLEPNQKAGLNSGDIISVGGQILHFELRDKSFKEKVNNIPLHMYQNPLVFFDQEAGLVSTAPEEYEEGRADEIPLDDSGIEKPNGRKKKLYIYAGVILVLIAALSQVEQESEKKQEKQTQNLDPFQKLSPAKQKIVVETYNLAKNLYLNANFELALQQLQKLHAILELGYKDSKRMEEYCENSRELKQQREALEQQKRAQEEIERRVAASIKSCASLYRTSMDLDGARSCLSEAIQMDPNNPEINNILSGISARIEAKKLAEKKKAEMEEKARRGRDLYDRAQSLHKSKQFLKAMYAYENHIYSGLPDPEGLVRKSRRNFASIEKFINDKKSRFMDQAKMKFQSNNLKDALIAARDALKVDPHDYRISYFIHKIEKELNNKMKKLYMDAVIEERFGNLEASRNKWDEILKNDVEDGEYYQKAMRKIKQYGF